MGVYTYVGGENVTSVCWMSYIQYCEFDCVFGIWSALVTSSSHIILTPMYLLFGPKYPCSLSLYILRHITSLSTSSSSYWTITISSHSYARLFLLPLPDLALPSALDSNISLFTPTGLLHHLMLSPNSLAAVPLS